jgi:hypothetical protein
MVKKEPISSNGLPQISLQRAEEIAVNFIPQATIAQLKYKLERKTIGYPGKPGTTEFDLYVQILLEVISGVRHEFRQRVLFQFNEICPKNGVVDWFAFRDLVLRFAPYYSTQKTCDLFLDGLHHSLPQTGVSARAFQLLLDAGEFEPLLPRWGDDYDMADTEEVAKFVNMKWCAGVRAAAEKVLQELRNERGTEFQKVFLELSKVCQELGDSCTKETSGWALSMLHMATLWILRYRFMQKLRRDSMDGCNEVRRLIAEVWG